MVRQTLEATGSRPRKIAGATMSATNSQTANEPTWDQLDAIVKKHKLDTLSTMDIAALVWRLSDTASLSPKSENSRDNAPMVQQTIREKSNATSATNNAAPQEGSDLISGSPIRGSKPLPAVAAPSARCVSVPRELLTDALNYIRHCGANAVMKGLSHPQYQIVEGIEHVLAAAPVAADTNRDDTKDAEIKLLRENFVKLEESLFGTGAGSAEEFHLRELAVWALIDEVEGYRRGVAITHADGDPLLRLKDKWTGLVDREFAVKTLATVREIRLRREAADALSSERDCE